MEQTRGLGAQHDVSSHQTMVAGTDSSLAGYHDASQQLDHQNAGQSGYGTNQAGYQESNNQQFAYQGQYGYQQPASYPYTPAAPNGQVNSVAQGFFSQWEPPPQAAAPPLDHDLRKRIEKLVEYAAKNGPQFEALMKEKQKENPAYAFLQGGEGYGFYRYYLWTTVNAQTQNPEPPPQAPGDKQGQAGGYASQQYYEQQQMGPPPGLGAVGASTMPAGGQPRQGQHQVHPPPPPPPPQYFDQYQQHSQSADQYGAQLPVYPAAPLGGGYAASALPPDVAMEMAGVLGGLTGTKEVIKSAKVWFMQRAAYACQLADGFRQRIRALSDPEQQLHVVYLINDILFNSLQHRSAPHELDPVALAFRPVLGGALALVYHGPRAAPASQERLVKILDFWAAKGVFDKDDINALEGDMMAGPPLDGVGGGGGAVPPLPANAQSVPALPSGAPAVGAAGMYFPGQWTPGQQQMTPGPLMHDHQGLVAGVASAARGGNSSFFQPGQPHLPPPFPPFGAGGAAAAGLPGASHQRPGAGGEAQAHAQQEPPPPYPLFPPGLIPGMVRRMQIGSGVPYSAISPGDIPTSIPPSEKSERYILARVVKFFREVGEANPLADEDGDEEELQDELKVVKRPPRARGGGGGGGLGLGPPPLMEVDPETGMLPDGSVESRGGDGGARAGLGANAEPEESQYGDVYSSYRKQRSSNYHTSLSVRAAMKYEVPQTL